VRELRFTLVSDGSSDKALLPVLSWLLETNRPDWLIHPDWADLRRLPRPPRDLTERIARAVELYPCDLLFVHRDAENQSRASRVAEIESAYAHASEQIDAERRPALVCAVPVRMLEAWLLIEEGTLRWAAENPKGRMAIELPAVRVLEDMADPKLRLHNLLVTASGLSGRRLKRFNVHSAIHRVADRIEDYSPLRSLPAFRELEQELMGCLASLE